MRRTLLAVLFVSVALFVVAVDAGDPLFIHVRDSELRSTPGFLSKIVANLAYGDELSYMSARPGWSQVTVTATGEIGWVHEGALRENQRTTLQSTGDSTTRTLTTREIALAGRGFSADLEKTFSSEKGLDFDAVNELEAKRVDPTQMLEFIEAGDLRTDILMGEGGE